MPFFSLMLLFLPVLRAMKWLILIIPMSAVVGSLCALFLAALEAATHYRVAHPAILFLLPFAGVVTASIYFWFGGESERGNNLILEQIQKPYSGVPLRMAPLVLVSTVISHLFGASVGREGTAVQIGGSIASGFANLFKLSQEATRVLLISGIAAGFGAVFGTPVAGAIFGLEVIAIGKVDYLALVPALLASLIADWVCHAWGIHHTLYTVLFSGYSLRDEPPFHTNLILLAKVALCGVCFGLCSLVFSESTHRLGKFFKTICPKAWLRPVIGGTLTIIFVYLLDTRDYLGLGITAPEPNGASILNFFGPQSYPYSALIKILFTIVALASEFKGGEVTPLFFIGAALGNILSVWLNAPMDLLAAIGFMAVFAGASNTPIACTMMGIELFGAQNTVYLATGCFIAYLCSGHTGIYLSQQIFRSKIHTPVNLTEHPLRVTRQNLLWPFGRSDKTQHPSEK
ncbi:Chloride/fluoride channel protein [Entomobacter blattae]|uniref:Chloride/fluoride channel protein n=2 Tax=Entomobacter blattae TaxID=2762277 RepID=A0A7H1NPY6_9PROT|nr:Chloride/fluoride channel protein [Entomobacter blattae]